MNKIDKTYKKFRIYLTYKELEEMACVDVCSVDIDNLTDLREIKIDRELPLEEKLASFEKQTKCLCKTEWEIML